MTTSGNYSFELTRNQIIQLAYSEIGAYPINHTLTSEQYQKASLLLNAMVQNWRGDNVFIWNLDWITIPIVASSTVLGTDSTDYRCFRNHTSAAENRPVTGSKWASFWTALTTSAASAWTTATAYTSIGNYFLDTNVVGIDLARTVETAGTTDQAMTPMSREEFFGLGNLNTFGKPSQYYFRRLPTPEIFFYPQPESTTAYVVELSVYRYPQTMDATTDTSTLLNEWMLPMVKGLARQLASSHGVSDSVYARLSSEFKEAYENAKMLDHENGDLRVMPNLRR